jgi:hypothetical protein
MKEKERKRKKKKKKKKKKKQSWLQHSAYSSHHAPISPTSHGSLSKTSTSSNPWKEIAKSFRKSGDKPFLRTGIPIGEFDDVESPSPPLSEWEEVSTAGSEAG